jgi:hypothetical protein
MAAAAVAGAANAAVFAMTGLASAMHKVKAAPHFMLGENIFL